MQRNVPAGRRGRDGFRDGGSDDRVRSVPPARSWARLWGGAAFGPFRRVGSEGYDPEFFGESEGRGDGAGSRRYREVGRGLIGGGEARVYGVGRELRDYVGGALEPAESTDPFGEEDRVEEPGPSTATERLD